MSSAIPTNAVEKKSSGPPSFLGDGLTHNVRGVYTMLENNVRRPTLWTKKMVEEMHELSHSLKKLVGGGKYRVTGFDGRPYQLEVPPIDPDTGSFALKIVGYQTLSQSVGEDGQYITENPYRRVPFFISTENDLKSHVSKQECIPKEGICSWQNGGIPWEIWRREFEVGKWAQYSKKLENLIKKHYEKLKAADKIVCVALGSLKTGSRTALGEGKFRDSEQPRRYLQHLVADKIRTTLEVAEPRNSRKTGLLASTWVQQDPHENTPHSKGKSKATESPISPTAHNIQSIRIIAQDPAYCQNCEHVLRNELNIDTTTHCDGLLNITSNTIVVSISPSYDLIGLVCDITSSFGGPLAMLCNEIEIDTKRWDGRFPIDPWLKWDQWDGKSSSIEREDGNAADHTTRSMVEYAAKCTVDVFGDFQDVYGFSYKDYRTKYSDVPFPGMVNSRRNMFPEGEEGDRKYKEKHLTAFKDDLALAKQVHPQVPEPNFGELRLYMRK